MRPKPDRPAASPKTTAPARSCFKPYLTQLLQTLKLDIHYTRGQGDFLYYQDESGGEIEVLDLIGGYGSLLFGHAHPVLVAEAQKLLSTGCPIHAQASIRERAGQLALELSNRAKGHYCVVFASSGAEAVEAAMKHAMLETGSRTFLALERAFHGKTLGAIQLTAHAQHREGFEIPGLGVVRIALNNIEQLEAAFARTPDVAGFIFEPIQGEGGVRSLESAFVRRAAELCAERGIPLIADECQTGLGRTGAFLASERLGVKPDYIILSKTLGGGLAKISALLICRERYIEEFDLKHTSTYADDDYSCGIALKAVELVDDKLLSACREKGEQLLLGLRRLAEEYPDIIADVRGAGLMIGVEFKRLVRSPSFTLRFLSAQEDLVLFLMGYLLNVHRIRAASTLSDRFTLRLEPSAFISQDAMSHFLFALEEVCARLQSHDASGLTAYLTDGSGVSRGEPRSLRSDGKLFAYDEARFRCRHGNSEAVRVAWLCHLRDADDLISLEPSFARLTFEKRERYLEQIMSRVAPVVMSAVEIRSLLGEKVCLYPIFLPATSSWIKRSLEARQLRLPQALVQSGIDLARTLHCKVVSLGQYTSIATLNGTQLAASGMGVTTGNSYAIALAVQAIQRAQMERGSDPQASVLVVVGAAGNIGRTCAEILAPFYGRVILVGSDKPGSRPRLQELAKRIPNAVATTSLSSVRSGDVVVAALNAVDAPLGPDDFGEKALVCDLSVPACLQPGTSALRPDLWIIKGGIVRLPFGEDLEIIGFPLPTGQTYACMAEGILLGFEGIKDSTFTGSLTADHVRRIESIASRHGFELADYKTSCVLGSERKEPCYVGAS